MRLLNSCRLTAGPQAGDRKWPRQVARTVYVVAFLCDASFHHLNGQQVDPKNKLNPQRSVYGSKRSQSALILFLFIQRGLSGAARIISLPHMLHFYLSPRAADAQRSRPITAGLPACDGSFVGEGKRLHPHVAFWKMPTPHSVKLLAERSLARCEHAHQRRSSRHGNITRLYAGCSPSSPNPHQPFTSLLYFFLKTWPT